MNEPDKVLAESLTILCAKASELEGKEFREFQPICEAVSRIQAASSEAEFFPNLIELSSAIAHVRKHSATKLTSLPVIPYHLWLPFKAEGAVSVPEGALADSARILKDGTSEIASRWKQFASLVDTNSESRLSDSKLSQLRDCLVDQFEDCNKWYAANVDRGKRFFNPSEGAFNDLFFRVMPTPVSSVGEFKLFIIALYQVFDEGLPNEVRQWTKHKENLLPPLLKVASEVFESESYKDFEKLRNKFAVHDENELELRMGPVFQRLIGVPTIARNETAKFLALQKSVLEMLSGVLNDVLKVLRSS